MNGIKIFNTQIMQKTYFGTNNKQEKRQANMPKKETGDSFEKKLKEKTPIIAGATALVLGAMLLIKNGKSKKVSETVANLSLKEFKQNGCFEDGIAKLKGKLFTGIITINSDEGNAATLIYDKGKITQSLINNQDKINTHNLKEYSYKPDGRKIIIQKEVCEFEGCSSPFELTTAKTVIFPDKSNLHFTDSKKKGTVFINGKPKAVEIKHGSNLNKYGHELPMSGSYKLAAVDSKTGTMLPQDEGELIIDKLIDLSDMNNNSPYYGISDAAFQ